jgi:AbrB family looped-hinge helix DNA binding protein
MIPAMDSMTAGQARVSVGRQGRVVIPARIREELRIVPGDELVARVEEERSLRGEWRVSSAVVLRNVARETGSHWCRVGRCSS